MIQIINNHEYEISEIAISDIQYDSEVKKTITSLNPLALLQNKPSSISTEGLSIVLITSPIIGYFKNEMFFLCAGLITFNIAVQHLEGKNANITVLAFTKKPQQKFRRQLIQLDLSHQLVNRLHINVSKYIGLILSKLFVKDDNTKSIQGSVEWRFLYPAINTKDKLAAHICVSKRNL